MNGETIAAIATAPGRAGVAVVRLSGPDVREIAARLGATDLAPGRIRFRRLHAPGEPSRTLDEAVVLFFAAPHSYTGEDVVEFQTHGGMVLPRRVLEASLAAGARLARRGEFTQRAYLSGRLDYEQAEAVLAAVDAKTDRAADAALAALAGCGARALRGFYDRALELSSTFEHALDVSEEELPDDFLPAQSAAVATLRSEIARELARRREGRLLRDGALVVLAGPPNAGKSSLLNALLGEHRAIVSDTPGTTRDSIEEGLDLGGWPVRLTDTAGLRATADRIEDEGVRRAEALIERAALVVYLSDDATAPEPPIKGETLLVQSKSDLRGGSAAPGWLAVSATTGDGLDALKCEIVRRLERFAATAPEPADAVQASRLNETLALFPTADESGDIVLLANRLRTIAEKLGSFIGAVYSEDLLDRLFSRFCVGK